MLKKVNGIEIYIPVFRNLLVSFMNEKNEIIDKETGYSIFTIEDFREVNTWAESTCKNILNKLHYTTDRESCPWCILVPGCTDCTYAYRHGSCGAHSSLYSRILTYIKTHHWLWKQTCSPFKGYNDNSISGIPGIRELVLKTKEKLSRVIIEQEKLSRVIIEQEKEKRFRRKENLYNQLLLLFMELKNDVLKDLTNREVFNDLDFQEASKWDEQTCRHILAKIDKDCTDASLCPWCRKFKNDCSACTYGDRHGKCNTSGISTYKKIIKSLYAKYGEYRICYMAEIQIMAGKFAKIYKALEEFNKLNETLFSRKK